MKRLFKAILLAALAPVLAMAQPANSGPSPVGQPVIQLVAGTGINLSPTNGRGTVTITSSGASSGIFTGLNSQTITGDANGAWAVAANGTNQNIALNPSGTGDVLITAPTATNGLDVFRNAAAVFRVRVRNSVGESYMGVLGSGDMILDTGSSAKYLAFYNGNEMARFAATTGNLLLHSLTTDGALGAALQIPSSATTGIALYNTSDVTTNTEYFELQWSGNLATLITGKTGSGTGRGMSLQTTTGSIFFKPDGTTALTLAASLDATFAGNAIIANGKTLSWGTSTILNATADGRLLLTSSAANDFGRLQLGGTSSSYPAIKRSGTEISFVLADDSASSPIRFSSGAMTGKMATYNGLTTAGYGIPTIVAAGRVTAQSAANSSIATYTLPATDGSFEVSANLNCTAATGLVTTLTCTYTDESNTARTMILPVQQLSGSFIAAGAITGTGAWETPVMHIRCKASTTITILTSTGTFNTVTYTAEGIIKQTS